MSNQDPGESAGKDSLDKGQGRREVSKRERPQSPRRRAGAPIDQPDVTAPLKTESAPKPPSSPSPEGVVLGTSVGPDAAPAPPTVVGQQLQIPERPAHQPQQAQQAPSAGVAASRGSASRESPGGSAVREPLVGSSGEGVGATKPRTPQSQPSPQSQQSASLARRPSSPSPASLAATTQPLQPPLPSSDRSAPRDRSASSDRSSPSDKSSPSSDRSSSLAVEGTLGGGNPLADRLAGAEAGATDAQRQPQPKEGDNRSREGDNRSSDSRSSRSTSGSNSARVPPPLLSSAPGVQKSTALSAQSTIQKFKTVNEQIAQTIANGSNKLKGREIEKLESGDNNFQVKMKREDGQGSDTITRALRGDTVTSTLSANAEDKSFLDFCEMNKGDAPPSLIAKPCGRADAALKLYEAAFKTGAQITLSDSDVDLIKTYPDKFEFYKLLASTVDPAAKEELQKKLEGKPLGEVPSATLEVVKQMTLPSQESSATSNATKKNI